MPRFGLLAVLLICSKPAMAAPHMLASLDATAATAGPLDADHDPVFVLPPPGLPLTWDSFLEPGSGAPMKNLCLALGMGNLPDAGRLPFDPAQVLPGLVDQGLCSGEAG